MSQPPQSDHMDDVDRHEWGPTEPDEMAVLSRLYAYDAVSGTFGFLIGDPRD